MKLTILKIIIFIVIALFTDETTEIKIIKRGKKRIIVEDENEENTYELLFKKILKALFYGMGVKEKQIDEMFNQTQVDAEEGK